MVTFGVGDENRSLGTDVDEDEVTEHQHERVYISLYYTHVPKLVDQDVVALDEATETVSPAKNATQILGALRGMGASRDTSDSADHVTAVARRATALVARPTGRDHPGW